MCSYNKKNLNSLASALVGDYGRIMGEVQKSSKETVCRGESSQKTDRGYWSLIQHGS